MSNNMTQKQIKELRDILSAELKEYNGEKNILLPFDTDSLEILLFDRIPEGGKRFAFYMEDIIKKIDLSNICFDNFNAYGFDFTPYKGIKINPWKLHNKSLYNAKCGGVRFIEVFDGVNVRGADFTGSKQAYINPQTIYDKTLFQTRCADVVFMGPFDGCNIEGTNFEGSMCAEINPQTIYDKSLYETKCADTVFIGSFDGVDVRGANFKGSFYAKINPQTVRDKSLCNTNCVDVELIDSFDGVHVEGMKLPQKEEKISIDKEIFKQKVKGLIVNNSNL